MIDLNPKAVHIWLLPFSIKEIEIRVLSQDEVVRGEEFKFPCHRDYFWMYRTALRKVLSLYCQTPPEKIVFGYTSFGKPYLINSPSIQFNLSHSKDMGVVALTYGSPIGVDIEWIKPVENPEAVVNRFFSPTEISSFKKIPDQNRLEVFYRLWTCKEAFIKGEGGGLCYSLDQFSIGLNTPPRILDIKGSKKEAAKWELENYPLQFNGHSYCIACSVQKRNVQIKKSIMLDYASHLLRGCYASYF